MFRSLMLAYLGGAVVAGPFSRAFAAGGPAPFSIRLGNWQAQVDPGRLGVEAILEGRARPIQIARGFEPSQHLTDLETSPVGARWKIPALGLSVQMSAEGSHLRVEFRAAREMQFTWPRSGEDAATKALIYPEGEGLYLPLRNAFWLAQAARSPCLDTHGGLSMPFWSYQIDRGTITYLVASDLETKVCLSAQGGAISAYAVHDFRSRDDLPPYEIEIWLGGASPVSPALDYRQWLIARGRYVTLQQKIAFNPDAEKLLGAMHAYVFGTGRALSFLHALRKLGVDRMWIGYAQDPRHDKFLVNRAYIADAERLGFLVGPYDTFENAQDPKSADDIASIWSNDLYPRGCIVGPRGKIQRGFHGRGCELSSQALALAEPSQHNIADRVGRYAHTGINSYFLDSDAFGQLFDDYSRAHGMTPALDRANRLARLKYIGETRRLVLGSEGGASWSVPAIDFAHGAEAVANNFLWSLEANRRVFGGWWPPERPAILFKPVEASESFATARYDPAYRLPLYQAAFHAVLVSADRWETPLPKFPNLLARRMLLELLYDVPSMWSLDLRQLDQNQRTFTRLYKFFSPIHREAGDLPLTQFEWLTADRKVQRTVFGGKIQLTANFGRAAFDFIPPRCIRARWLAQNRSELFCP